MEDPQCVRCSACVQQCPTGVLAFGRLGDDGVPLLDQLAASPVRLRESDATGPSAGATSSSCGRKPRAPSPTPPTPR